MLLYADFVDSLLLLCCKVLQSGTCWLPFYAEAFSTLGNPVMPHWLELDLSTLQFFRYAYPPPDGNILTNIVNALIAVPRFYNQVY